MKVQVYGRKKVRILIWGTGRAVAHILNYRVRIENVIAFIDNNSSGREFMGLPVLLPEKIVTIEYDLILVANRFSKEIREQCIRLNINLDKVVFLYNNYSIEDLNTDYEYANKFLDKSYIAILQHKFHVVSTPEIDEVNNVDYGHFISDPIYENDYIRFKALELVASEIHHNNVEGVVAELGVFRGEFAKHINRLFADRKCYLFDTFQGFANREAATEVQSNNCNQAFVEAFKDTSMQLVWDNLPNKEQIIMKKGYFPESLDGLDEQFAFVSIDVDFGESIYQGIKYFYPRLCQGGYIFIHDYNSRLSGVRQAVERYEMENVVHISKVPLCDLNGTLIITK